MKMQEHRHGISSCHSIAGMVAESYRRTRTVCPKPIWIFQPGGTRELEPTITLERVPETPPGDQAQVDFAQFQLQFTDEPTITRIVWLFSFVLGFSRTRICRRFCVVAWRPSRRSAASLTRSSTTA